MKQSRPQPWIPPLCQLISNSFYDLKIESRELVPNSGAFILASNHVSYLDWVFLMAAMAPRPVRFMIDENYAGENLIGKVSRLSHPIPVCVDFVRPKAIKKSISAVVSALEQGDIVGFFPEGAITRSGKIEKFRSGIEMIAQASKAPVVPAKISGLWGSAWSWSGGRLVLKKPLGIRPLIQLKFGAPISPEHVKAESLRKIITSL